jgi:nucleotide-binding universal stress UspA family protein
VYKHLLIATDGSELADKAVQQGVALAKALSASVSGVTVTESWASVAPGEIALAFPRAEYEKSAAANAARILSSVADAAKEAGVKCEVVHMKDQFPAEGIIDAAKARGCHLIVMSSHGRRGFMRLVLGSQANRPVLICR